jgi:hypothetical protein
LTLVSSTTSLKMTLLFGLRQNATVIITLRRSIWATLKKIVLLFIKNGWLQRDPYIGFKLTKKEVERPFLTANELQEMTLKEFKTERLTLVSDIFLFSRYTGLAYADVKKLKRKRCRR